MKVNLPFDPRIQHAQIKKYKGLERQNIFNNDYYPKKKYLMTVGVRQSHPYVGQPAAGDVNAEISFCAEWFWKALADHGWAEGC